MLLRVCALLGTGGLDQVVQQLLHSCPFLQEVDEPPVQRFAFLRRPGWDTISDDPTDLLLIAALCAGPHSPNKSSFDWAQEIIEGRLNRVLQANLHTSLGTHHRPMT